MAGWVLAWTWAYRLAGKMMRWLLPKFGPWGRQRDLPEAPPQSFRELYRRRNGR